MAQITLDGIVLPPDLVWEDEFSWSPVKMKEDVALSGTTILHASARIGGRRLTLKSQDEIAWVDRATLLTLLQRRNSASLTPMLLVLGDGRSFGVRFDQTGEGAIAATPLQPGKEPAAGDWYVVTIKLMEA